MRYCAVCKRKFAPGSGHLFYVPRDSVKRAKWSKICGRNFASSNLICTEHFLETSIIRTGNKVLLLPNAEPCPKLNFSNNDINEVGMTPLRDSCVGPEALNDVFTMEKLLPKSVSNHREQKTQKK